MTGYRMAEQHGTEQNSAGPDATKSANGGSAKKGHVKPNDAPSQPAAGTNPSDPAESGAENPGGNQSLREQLEAARAERDANYNLYLRSQAELQNYRKRVQKEADEMRLYQSLPLARDLLPALDNLHRTLAAAETSKSVDKLLDGVRMVAKQIEAALNRHQIVAIEAAGKPFDPNLHQAVQQMPTTEHPPMTVMHEVERGFTLQDRVVRPATVIVAQAPADPAAAETARENPKNEPSIEGE
jgi:molecular chaperone GrpE